MDVMAPVVLVQDVGNDDLGATADGGRSGGAGTAVMNHGGHVRKKMKMGILVDKIDIRVLTVGGDVLPEIGDHDPQAVIPGGFDNNVHGTDLVLRRHAPETGIHRRRSVLEKRGQPL